MNKSSLILPRHIAFIVDGNRRWARSRHLPVTEGHRRGAEVVMRVIDDCLELGIPYLTFYTFSTENWKRTEKEVGFLMRLGEWWVKTKVNDLKEKGVRINILGRLEELSPRLRDVLQESMRITRDNNRMLVNLAINYGGRSEIVDAVRRVIQEGKKDIDEREFSRYLYTDGIPDPDLLVRTGGELRVSNFLLYQIAYTELYFTPVYWPDFTREELNKALEDFSRRERRWGK